MKSIPPVSWLGLLGGGQLGRMFSMAAQSLGYRVATASALVQSYQTLSPDPENPVITPYRRLPQLKLNASRPDLVGGLVFDWSSEYVRFEHPLETRPDATRTTAYPQLSLPIQGAGYFVTPKFGPASHPLRYRSPTNFCSVAGLDQPFGADLFG